MLEATCFVGRVDGMPVQWITCEGYRLDDSIGSLLHLLCQRLVADGYPDQPIRVEYVGHRTSEHPSIHLIARRARWIGESTDMRVYLLLRRIEIDPAAFSALPSRTRKQLLTREVVSADGQVLERGRQLIAAHDAVNPRVEMTSKSTTVLRKRVTVASVFPDTN